MIKKKWVIVKCHIFTTMMWENSSITKTILWSPNVWLWLTLLYKHSISIVKWMYTKVDMPPNNNSSNFIILNMSTTSRILYVKTYLPVKDSCTQMINYWKLNNKDPTKSTALKRKLSSVSTKRVTVRVLLDFINFVNLVVAVLSMPPIY